MNEKNIIKRGLIITILLASMAGAVSANANDAALGDGLFARIVTNRGDIVIRLEYQRAPLTVTNFVALAEGRMGPGNRPFYNGLTFHRVVPNFVIQAGCPLGTGTGGPGYQFPNEVNPALRHDGPGVVAMANAGPDTNGSQFYITQTATSHLDGGYSVFGRVVEGQNVVNNIRQGDRIDRVTIIRNGAAAQAFRADQASFDALRRSAEAAKAAELGALRNADIAEIERRFPNAVVTPAGLRFMVTRQGTGARPAPGRTVRLAYKGTLLSGRVFDDSSVSARPLEFRINGGQVIPGINLAVSDMVTGERRTVIIPPELAYGEAGIGNGLIPPNSFLIFELELLEIR